MWDIVLSKQGGISLSRQLFYQIKNLILEGKIAAGEALLSSRRLAKDLSVSRSTVNEAYDMLIAEGFVISRQGAPTRVKEGVRLEKSKTAKLRHPVQTPKEFVADFKTGQPDVSCFPHYMWRQMLNKSYEKLQDADFGYFGTAGYGPLREEISQWVFRTRGIAADPQDIFITSGTTQALNIFIQMLYKREFPIAVEEPGHLAAVEILKNRKIPFVGAPVDDRGVKTDLLANARLSAIYVTPSHQFPLGGILPAERRTELIRIARKQDFYIIEDDYDSEFRYEGAPITPLCSMDSQRVLYTGSFSKIMYPALRVGFVILPPELHKQWLNMRKYFDVQNPVIEQAALTEFLKQRKLDKYLQKLCQMYGEKRKLLSECIFRYFGDQVRLLGDKSGLHLVLQIPGFNFNEEFITQSQALGIRIYPIKHYCLEKGKHQDKIMLGYGHLKPGEIHKSVGILYHFINRKM